MAISMVIKMLGKVNFSKNMSYILLVQAIWKTCQNFYILSYVRYTVLGKVV